MTEGPLQQRDVTIEGTEFHFGVMEAIPAYRLFEVIRPGVAEAIAKLDASTIDSAQALQDAAKGTDAEAKLTRQLAQVAGIVLALDPVIVEQVRVKLFEHVEFRNDSVKSAGRIRLAGQEELGFKGLEGVHVYEVLARAFAVNFRKSWDALASRIPGIGQIMLRQPSATSPPSSDTP